LYTYVITRGILTPLLVPVPPRDPIDLAMLVQSAMVPAILVFLLRSVRKRGRGGREIGCCGAPLRSLLRFLSPPLADQHAQLLRRVAFVVQRVSGVVSLRGKAFLYR